MKAVEVVHEDAHLVVVDKPTGLPTTAPGGGDCLTRRLTAQRREKLHPTSRLDAEVTGLVTFARSKRGIRALEEARREGRYARTYVALAAGELPDRGAWTASIALSPRDRRLRIAVPAGGSGARLQAARTRFTVAERAPGVLLLHLFPETGRTHQLRVHAAHAAAPLLGDHRYGGPKRLTLPDGRVLRARRTMLHCARLGLPGVEGGALELHLPPPTDFADLFAGLGGSLTALAAERTPGP